MQINPNVIWATITGLAVGYIFGNALPMHGGGGGGGSGSSASSSEGSMGPASDMSIPSDWLTERDIGASEVFAGLTASQRYLALKVLNTKPCDCGCPHGSIARCKKEDPACPVAPKEIEIAANSARAGKTFDEIYAAVQKPSVVPSQQQQAPAKGHRIALADSTPVRGVKNAKVTIIMFSDFQCPFCGRVEPVLKQVMDTYPKDVRIAWHNYPLPFHEHAHDAAEAAMAADAQGKFWAMHDKLFENQQSLDRASLEKFAGEVGVDAAKVKAAIEGATYKDKIQAETALGNSVGVNGTPAFFINGQFLNGAQPFTEFKRVIDAELEKANALLKSGTPQDKLYQAEMAAIPDDTAPAPPTGAAQ